MKLKPFIKWSGSKRSQAHEIISYFPESIETFYEPFLGSGAILGHLQPKKAIGSDINEPLMMLWKELQKNPKSISDDYRDKWNLLQNIGHTFFYEVRDNFNKSKSPLDFLFLTRTCVNGLIRFNKNGEFNNSLHHTRKGINPDMLEKIIFEWANIVRGYKFSNQHYKKATASAKKGDFIYLDPPYFNTGTRYFGVIDYEEFLNFLKDLNNRNIKFALSYDGTRGDTSYVVDLPKELYARHLLIPSGNSAFNKVQNGKVEQVYESLYLNY